MQTKRAVTPSERLQPEVSRDAVIIKHGKSIHRTCSKPVYPVFVTQTPR